MNYAKGHCDSTVDRVKGNVTFDNGLKFTQNFCIFVFEIIVSFLFAGLIPHIGQFVFNSAIYGFTLHRQRHS